MKNYLLVCFLWLFSCGILVAQERTVTGTVTDGESGETLPGASVVVKGTTTGTITGVNGDYSINVTDGSVLVISFVGYATQEVTVGSRSVIDVTLATDVEQLGEVVVIGYGETSIKDATGAVTAVSAKDFNGGVIGSPEQLIQGKAAGVRITGTSGAPGAGVNIQIRGSNSVTSNNNPLFVVDGVPLGGGNTSNSGTNVGFGSATPRNPLNFINPNDIQSMSILKDASATAIYGSRGANGVVIITTKSGRGNKLKVEYGSTASVSTTAKRFDLLDRDEYLEGITQFGGNASEQDFGNDTDWQDVIFRTAFSHNQNLSISKGFATGSFRTSLSYDNQQGIIEDSDLERLTGRINATKTFMDERLKFDLQSTFSRVNDQFAPLSGSAGSRGDLLGAAYSANPTWPNDPTFSDIPGGVLNPANVLENYESTAATNRLLMNISASYEITPGLTAKLTYGVDKSNSDAYALTNGNALNLDLGAGTNGRGAWNELNLTNDLFEATVTYKKDFGSSSLEVVGGYSFQDFGAEGFNAIGWGFGSTNFATMEGDLTRSVEALESAASAGTNGFVQQYGISENLNGGEQNSGAWANVLFPTVQTGVALATPSDVNIRSITVDVFDNVDKLQSFFGRANYTLNNKYLFTFTLRADGSSRFGEDNQYGVFPSGAFAWQLGEEDFIGDAFSTLKLRVGYGVTGNQDGLGFGNAIQRQRFGAPGIADDGTINIPGASDVAFANTQLQWEETSQATFGIDFGLANDRFYGSFDLYRKSTSNLLLRITAAQPAVQPFVFQNIDGNVINQGIELALNYDWIKTSDVKFTTSFNISYNENELQDFNGQIPAGTIRGQGLTGAFAQQLQSGQPLFSFYLRDFNGFDPNGQPDQVDRQEFVDASALPTVNTGLSLNLTYKNWDFSTFLAGQFGHWVYNNTQNAFFTAGSIAAARNVTQDVLTNGEAGSAAAEVSTRFLQRGDFVRAQNLAIGYNLPISGEGALKSLRISFNAQNLFLITGYDGLDPEVSTQPAGVDLLNGLPTAGIDYTAYPRARTFSLGFNASF